VFLSFPWTRPFSRQLILLPYHQLSRGVLFTQQTMKSRPSFQYHTPWSPLFRFILGKFAIYFTINSEFHYLEKKKHYLSLEKLVQLPILAEVVCLYSYICESNFDCQVFTRHTQSKVCTNRSSGSFTPIWINLRFSCTLKQKHIYYVNKTSK